LVVQPAQDVEDVQVVEDVHGGSTVRRAGPGDRAGGVQHLGMSLAGSIAAAAGYVDPVSAEDQSGDTRGQPAADGGAGALSYEQARDQLTEVVRQLEAGGLTLERSLDLWERGERLAAICEQWLEGARARLAAAAATRPPDTGPGTAP
jgi:exodeoxyribonuclease VII small subunit